jgi:hypothetical protein
LIITVLLSSVHERDESALAAPAVDSSQRWLLMQFLKKPIWIPTRTRNCKTGERGTFHFRQRVIVPADGYMLGIKLLSSSSHCVSAVLCVFQSSRQFRIFLRHRLEVA